MVPCWCIRQHADVIGSNNSFPIVTKRLYAITCTECIVANHLDVLRSVLKRVLFVAPFFFSPRWVLSERAIFLLFCRISDVICSKSRWSVEFLCCNHLIYVHTIIITIFSKLKCFTQCFLCVVSHTNHVHLQFIQSIKKAYPTHSTDLFSISSPAQIHQKHITNSQELIPCSAAQETVVRRGGEPSTRPSRIQHYRRELSQNKS